MKKGKKERGFAASPLLQIGVIVFFVIGIYGTGLYTGKASVQAKWDLASAKADSDAQKALRQALETAQQQGDILSAALAQSEHKINQLTLEKTHALKQTTTGRACFNAATVSVLNRPKPPSAAQSLLPTSASALDAARGAATADSSDAETYESSSAFESSEASDTDVAEWIANAQGQFDTCRKRLDALIDFEEQSP